MEGFETSGVLELVQTPFDEISQAVERAVHADELLGAFVAWGSPIGQRVPPWKCECCPHHSPDRRAKPSVEAGFGHDQVEPR